VKKIIFKKITKFAMISPQIKGLNKFFTNFPLKLLAMDFVSFYKLYNFGLSSQKNGVILSL